MRILNRGRRKGGFAVLVVLMMLSFMLVFVMANSNALFQLKREVKLVDQKQQKRWEKLEVKKGGTNNLEKLPK